LRNREDSEKRRIKGLGKNKGRGELIKGDSKVWGKNGLIVKARKIHIHISRNSLASRGLDFLVVTLANVLKMVYKVQPTATK
jgi:hypothetical protein